MKNLNELQKEGLKTFEILVEPGQFTEVRLLNTKQGTLSGYYNDVDKLIEHIKRYDGNYNIYITMNALSEGIEARGKNHLKSYAKNTTSDKEIRCRRWILIDLDPERPAGISSTEQELKLSEELGRKIQGYLTDCGFPEPVTALSGNGFHLFISCGTSQYTGNDKSGKGLSWRIGFKVFYRAGKGRYNNL